LAQTTTELSIEFQPMGRRDKFPSGQSILDYTRRLGIGISSVCGGKGVCGKCKVQVLKGNPGNPRDHERKALSPSQLAAGWRLACQCYPTEDCTIHIPVESMTTPQRTQLEGIDIPVKAKSAIKVFTVELKAPSLQDTMGDADRLLAELKKQGVRCSRVDSSVLRTLSPKIRDWSWKCEVFIRNDEVIAVGPKSGPHLGLAVDLGSTKIAAYLIDLNTGKMLASRGIMNPQISYGEDIIARCNMAIASPDGAIRLQKLAADAISEIGATMAKSIGTSPENIVDAVVVGNTAMHHLYLGLPVKQLSLAPFIPAVNHDLDIKARDIGIHLAPGAYIHVLPNIAGFVGADHVAMLLATKASQSDGVVIALDIGTNTEISLINHGKIDSISCASGPAFEGGHIRDGMRAGTGAIERVRITDGVINIATIDDAPPIGICGSGIIDTVAQLYSAGYIDGSGRMKVNDTHIQDRDGIKEFVLAPADNSSGRSDIVFTQHDVRELQLGKAAIRAGIATLIGTNSLRESDISEIIIAGAFGSYIDVISAVDIGLLPPIPLDHFRQVGNAAGMGAKRALISTSQRTAARSIAAKARYIELAGNSIFNEFFISAMQLGRYYLENGKRREID
jgi:uncharacterized 2Fe-2S/4Fe-4S cluster protein (DUF4445 family)